MPKSLIALVGGAALALCLSVSSWAQGGAAVVVLVVVVLVRVPGVLVPGVRAERKAAQEPTTPPARPAPGPRKMHPVATRTLLMRPIRVMVGRLQAQMMNQQRDNQNQNQNRSR